MAYSNVATLWKLVKGLNHVLSRARRRAAANPAAALRFAREAAVWGRAVSGRYLGGDPDSIGRHEDAPAPSPPGEADEAQASLLQEAEAAAEELASFLQADDGGDGGQVSASDAEATQLNRLVTSLRKADELTLRTIQLLRRQCARGRHPGVQLVDVLRLAAAAARAAVAAAADADVVRHSLGPRTARFRRSTSIRSR